MHNLFKRFNRSFVSNEESLENKNITEQIENNISILNTEDNSDSDDGSNFNTLHESDIDSTILDDKYYEKEIEKMNDTIQSKELRNNILTQELLTLYNELEYTRKMYDKIYLSELLNKYITLLPKNLLHGIGEIFNYDKILMNPETQVQNDVIIKILNVLHVYEKSVSDILEKIYNINTVATHKIDPKDVCVMCHDRIIELIPHIYGVLFIYDGKFDKINKTKKYSPTDQMEIADIFCQIKERSDKLFKMHSVYATYIKYVMNPNTYVDNSYTILNMLIK